MLEGVGACPHSRQHQALHLVFVFWLVWTSTFAQCLDLYLGPALGQVVYHALDQYLGAELQLGPSPGPVHAQVPVPLHVPILRPVPAMYQMHGGRSCGMNGCSHWYRRWCVCMCW